MKTKDIAILGAASHIAKGLIYRFLRAGDVRLHLYARSADKVRAFLRAIGKRRVRDCIVHEGFGRLMQNSYDALINCVGVGTLKKLEGDYSRYFTITEEYDNLAIRYLCERRPGAVYISVSSGAVYGRELNGPAEKITVNRILVNHVVPEDYYAIARLNSEAKHRAFKDLRIADLRLFSYFSRFADLSEGYFITEVVKAVMSRKALVTDGVNIVRDYVHPEDLYDLVVKCIAAGKINAAFDAVSAAPVAKREILEYFSAEYGLKYRIRRSPSVAGATGAKKIYCSAYRAAARLGYRPAYTSMDAIREEARHIIGC